MEFNELVESSFDEDFLRHEEANAYVVGLWLISPFRFDETNRSWFWLETHYHGVERLGWTGPDFHGIWVTGFQVATEDFSLDFPDAETARGMYFHYLKVIDRTVGGFPEAYED